MTPAASERRATWAIWLIVLAPLAWIPGGFSRFVVAKLLVTLIGVGLAATVDHRHSLHRWVSRLFLLGAALFTVAALTGDTPLASLVGRWPRYEGLPMLAAYAGCAWAGARLLDRPARMRTLATAVATMACTLGAFSLFDVLGWNPTGVADVERSGALLGNATDQGLIGMVALAILFRPAVETRRALYLCGVAGATATIALSGSRFALLAAAAVVVGLAWFARAASSGPSGGAGARHRALVVPLLGGLSVLVVAALAVPVTRERLLSGETLRGRLLTWDLTLPMVADRPWLGWGPSRYVDAVGRYETEAWTEWVGQRNALDSPHNWLLQVALAGGAPLLLCALALAGLTGWLGWRTVRERPELLGVFAAVAGYGAAMLINFTNPISTCLVAFLAGAVVAVPRSATATGAERHWEQWRDRGVIGLVAVAVAGLVVLAASEVMLDRGFRAAADGDTAAARRYLDRATGLRPADPDADMLSAQALAVLANGAGDLDAADAAAGHARVSLDLTPDTYQSQLALGVALLVEERPADAHDVLDRAVADFPLRAGGWVKRGLASYAMGDVAAARSDLERAIALGDRSARGLLRQITG